MAADLLAKDDLIATTEDSAGAEKTPSSDPFKASDPVSGRAQLLLVEDNPADVFLVNKAIEAHKLPVNLIVLEDGDRAVKFFERAESEASAPCPAILLLDLNLPKVSGTEVLRRVRQGTRCNRLPVIILTSSNSAEDRRETARLGATHYFRKPASYHEFLKIGDVLRDVLESIHS